MNISLHKCQEQIAASHIAMTARKYQDAIKSSTKALDELMENHVLELLDLHSTAYEKQGLLSRALDDAARIIQYAPTSAFGYLRAGSIHVTSGKPSLAVDSYKQGLESVPESHPQHCQIQEEHNKAILRTQTRIDIIGKLALEILYEILLYLDAESLWICLTVSSVWCRQATHCGSWWDSVTVKETGTKMDQYMCDAIPFVKDQILNLELARFSSANLVRQYLMHLMESGAFTKIRALSLKGFRQNMEPEDFGTVLWQIRYTLTSLKLEFGEEKPYRLISVLANCPNIEDLLYTTTGTIAFGYVDDRYACRVSCKKLLNLDLSYASMSYTALCSYIELCPNLRRMTLKSSIREPLNVYGDRVLSDYCPKLKILGINCTEGLPDMDSCEHLTDDGGVVHMAILLTSNQSAKHIHTQSHSIEQLSIVQPKYIGYRHQYHGPYNRNIRLFIYPKLRSFKFTSYTNSNDYHYQGGEYTSFTEHHVCTVLFNSPNLVDLSVLCVRASAFFGYTLGETLQTTIRHLTLNMVLFPYTSGNWVNRLLSSFHQVQSLKIQNCLFLDDKVVPSLAALNSLQQLTITQCKSVTSDGLTKLLKQVVLQPYHKLKTLNLSDFPRSLSIPMICLLAKINSFQELRITNDQHLDPDTVNHLIEQAPDTTLRTIEILNCFRVNFAASWSSCVGHLRKEGITLPIE